MTKLKRLGFCETLPVRKLKNMCKFNSIHRYSRLSKDQLVGKCCQPVIDEISGNEFITNIKGWYANPNLRRLNISALIPNIENLDESNIGEAFRSLTKALDQYWYGLEDGLPNKVHCAVMPSSFVDRFEYIQDWDYPTKSRKKISYVENNNMVCWVERDNTVYTEASSWQSPFLRFRRAKHFASNIEDFAVAIDGLDALFLKEDGSPLEYDRQGNARSAARGLRSLLANNKIRNMDRLMRMYAESRNLDHEVSCEIKNASGLHRAERLSMWVDGDIVLVNEDMERIDCDDIIGRSI